MEPKEKLLKKLIRSLNTEPENWVFGEYTAVNKDWGISLWTASIPILNLSVYEPIEISFPLLGKKRLYRAMIQCKTASLLKLVELNKQ